MLDDPIPRLKEQLRQAILADVGRLNQLVAAHMLRVDQARMSNIELGRLERFSLQKLIRLLARLNRRVDLAVVVVGPLPGRGYEALWEARERALALRARMEARQHAIGKTGKSLVEVDAIAKTDNRLLEKDASIRIAPDKTTIIF